MKRNDIGDSCLLWLLERVLATRGVHPAGGRSRRPVLASTPHNVTYAGTPTIGNAQSLSFPFHSPRRTFQGRPMSPARSGVFLASASARIRQTNPRLEAEGASTERRARSGRERQQFHLHLSLKLV